MTKLETLLSQLHEELAASLLERIQSGEAKPADLNVARQFLKDNGIDSVPTDDSKLSELQEVYPFEEDDEASLKFG